MDFTDDFVTIKCGDAWDLAATLPDSSVNTIVTSPPYWGLRDYGEAGQFGLESTPGEYVDRLVDLFSRLRHALRDDGTVWLNLGDSYAGPRAGSGDTSTDNHGNTASRTASRRRDNAIVPRSDGIVAGLKPKDLVGVPWRVAFALQADGWYLRQDIIWHKPSPMPESVTDRCTKAHEYLFLLSKSPRYYYDHEAIKEAADLSNHRDCPTGRSGAGVPPGSSADSGMANGRYFTTRNKRSVWTVPTVPFSAAHFAAFPPALIMPCIMAGCPEGGTVLDPFMGSGTTAAVARSLGRHAIGFELNPEYIEIAAVHRLAQGQLL